MATLEPEIAISSCERALRELMIHTYPEAYGSDWLTEVTNSKQRSQWPNRRDTEVERRKGAATIPDEGLSYAQFHDLIAIAEKHWDPLRPALENSSGTTLSLLKQLEELRNSVAHGRTILVYERDLISGISGQVRSQVAKYMSNKDPAGDYYPRIESVIDNFGHEISGNHEMGDLAGLVTTKYILYPGEVVTFTAIGVDPQDRSLRWEISQEGKRIDSVIAESGQAAVIQWPVTDLDVGESIHISIHMKAEEAKYHRARYFDQRAAFGYIVRPPH